jgi:hypothetical protein
MAAKIRRMIEGLITAFKSVPFGFIVQKTGKIVNVMTEFT